MAARKYKTNSADLLAEGQLIVNSTVNANAPWHKKAVRHIQEEAFA